MQRVLPRAVAAGGALALLLGAAACTGPEEPPSGGSSTVTDEGDGEDSTAPGPARPEDPRSDGGGESPFDQEELDAASQRFVDLLQVIDDQDWEAACGMVLDPRTGTAPEGARLEECADRVESVFAERTEPLAPGAFDALDATMVEAVDEGDGTVSLSVLGDVLDIPMVQGRDGLWYLSIPF